MSKLPRRPAWLLAGYTLLLAYWMLLGFGRTSGDTYRYNVKPFFTIRMYLDHYDYLSWSLLLNIGGNIGVFVPFGLLIPAVLRTGGAKPFGVFLAGLAVLEFAQFATKRGSLDVDDLILNALGYGMGYIICMAIRTRRN